MYVGASSSQEKRRSERDGGGRGREREKERLPIRERETMRVGDREREGETVDGTREESRGEEVAPGLEVQRSCQAVRPGTSRAPTAVGRECALRSRNANIEDG